MKRFMMLMMVLACSLTWALPVMAADIMKKDNTLVVGTPVDPVGLDPHKVRAVASRLILNNIFERLVAKDKNYQPMPGLAKSWTISDDGLIYTFKLRRGVKFHNGREMKAADVKYSYDRMMDPKTAMPYKGTTSQIESVEALDDYTIQITLKNVSGNFLIMTASEGMVVIVPKEEVEKQGGTFTHPVGTGPYKFVEYKSDQHVILERFEDYAQPGIPSNGTGGNKPCYIEKIVFKPIKEASVRDMALKKGEIDFSTRLSWEQFDKMKNDPNVNVYEGLSLSHITLDFSLKNSESPWPKNKNFRKAVAYSLDLQEIVDGAVFGHSSVNPSLIGMALPYYSDAHRQGYGKNLEKAKEYLQKSGYNGEVVKLNVCKRYPMAYNTGIIAQQMMAEIGINTELVTLEWAATLKTWRTGKFDIQSFIYGGVSDPSSYMARLHSKRNYKGYANPKLDALADAADREMDFEKRKELYEQIHLIMLEDAPLIKICDHNIGFGTTKRVKGITVWPDTTEWRLWNARLDDTN